METCTAGAAGGPGKPTGSNPGRAPRSDPTLLDTEEYPALDLACCYPDRWGCETVIGRHKTDMGEGQPVLRSGDPEGVTQEMWALFAVYQAICQLAGIGAAAMGIPPEGISFPHALQAATDTVAAFPP